MFNSVSYFNMASLSANSNTLPVSNEMGTDSAIESPPYPKGPVRAKKAKSTSLSKLLHHAKETMFLALEADHRKSEAERNLLIERKNRILARIRKHGGSKERYNRLFATREAISSLVKERSSATENAARSLTKIKKQLKKERKLKADANPTYQMFKDS